MEGHGVEVFVLLRQNTSEREVGRVSLDNDLFFGIEVLEDRALSESLL